jgi:hypothetical protein
LNSERASALQIPPEDAHENPLYRTVCRFTAALGLLSNV